MSPSDVASRNYMDNSSLNITQMLHAWGLGDNEALHKLIEIVHDELHKLAARHLKQERPGHTLQTTDLLNEAFAKLVDKKSIDWKNRTHFFAVAAQIMRRILIDHARSRLSIKRGAGGQRVTLEEVALVSDARAEELISLDAALIELAKIDPRKSRIVEMKFFGGMTTDEIADLEQLSARSIEREWRKAKAWLYNAIK